MIATSSGYSWPANRPSLPSRATSTVNPASARRAWSVSRSVASSSTTRTRMPDLPSARASADRAAHRVDAHRPDSPGIVEEPQHVHGARAVALGFSLDHARPKALLDHLDRLIHGQRGLRHGGL